MSLLPTESPMSLKGQNDICMCQYLADTASGRFIIKNVLAKGEPKKNRSAHHKMVINARYYYQTGV